MKKFFNGYYYKNQKDDNVVCFIKGETEEERFLQVITKEKSYYLPLPKSAIFEKDRVYFALKHKDLIIKADLQYINLTPLNYDIMGFLKYLPTQCRHKIVSMRHDILGSVTINGKVIDFTGGVGYIEGDSGTSFPKTYTWFQCNDFKDKTAIFGAVADVVAAKYKFKGCISVVHHKGVEYRFATYKGAKIMLARKNCVVLKQGNMMLIVQIESCNAHKLSAPTDGKMSRIIKEHPACNGRFRFYNEGKLVFDKTSKNVGYECEL